MPFCSECGVKTDETSKFCGNCGSKLSSTSAPISSSPSYSYDTQPSKAQEPSSGYSSSVAQESYSSQTAFSQPQQNRYIAQQNNIHPSAIPKPGLLQFVIIINWIGFGLLAIATLIFLFIFFPIGILVGLFTALAYWIARGLSDLNNSARIVALVLSSIGLISDIFSALSAESFPIIGIVIGGITIYTLGFHQETLELFRRYG